MTQFDQRDDSPTSPDPWHALGKLTAARIGLGRAGDSVPTRAMLDFQLAHAQARDAVHQELDVSAITRPLAEHGNDVLPLHSAAPDRATFIARPDLGRTLDESSRACLETRNTRDTPYDCVIVIADGLSAQAVENHAVALLLPLLNRLQCDGWHLAPLTVAQQARVAIGDEIGALLNARMTVILIGERPGLSSPDSLGIYLTYDPMPGRTNAERNCISNVREPYGLSYAVATHKLVYLMTESRHRKLSGVHLKETAPELPVSRKPTGNPREAHPCSPPTRNSLCDD